jgi:hypothetical protein
MIELDYGIWLPIVLQDRKSESLGWHNYVKLELSNRKVRRPVELEFLVRSSSLVVLYKAMRALTSRFNTAVTTRTWAVIAHEIGHNFGAIHDCVSGCTQGSSNPTCCPFTATSCNSNADFISTTIHFLSFSIK